LASMASRWRSNSRRCPVTANPPAAYPTAGAYLLSGTGAYLLCGTPDCSRNRAGLGGGTRGRRQPGIPDRLARQPWLDVLSATAPFNPPKGTWPAMRTVMTSGAAASSSAWASSSLLQRTPGPFRNWSRSGADGPVVTGTLSLADVRCADRRVRS
jgi:hypothetical protein